MTLAGLVVAAVGGCPAQRTDPAEIFAPRSTANVSSKADQAGGKSTNGQPAGATAPQPVTAEQLHAALRAHNPQYTGSAQFRIEQGQVLAADLSNAELSDLTPLAGWRATALDLSDNPLRDLAPLQAMQLSTLYLERTQVSDLTPLAGMPLHELYLGFTPISDSTPLKGAPLVNLNLIGSAVQDISPLADAPLEMLWLSDTQVHDLKPLAGSPLVSLTLKGTQVSDLAAVRKLPKLERLHIADTPVTDLTPLRGMPLTRLVFSPANITTGIADVRKSKTLQQLGTVFEDTTESLMSPTEFWQRYDQGQWQ